jgi:CMP-N-acetylneuraminic acid synthetase
MSPKICALLIGREGSVGLPGKNTMPLLGRPLLRYPMLAAEQCPAIDYLYFSTDSLAYKHIGKEHGWRLIDRPPELATKTALAEDTFLHGYRWIQKDLASQGEEPSILVLLLCNAPTLLSKTLTEGIRILQEREELDSAVTVSSYNMWSPLRARKESKDGTLVPFVPFEVFGDPKKLSCDRDSQGDVWFADMSTSIVRARCFEHLEEGLLPQKWMGQKIYPLKQWGGCDVDFRWQIPLVEYWLREHGFTEERTPYSQAPLLSRKEP